MSAQDAETYHAADANPRQPPAPALLEQVEALQEVVRLMNRVLICRKRYSNMSPELAAKQAVDDDDEELAFAAQQQQHPAQQDTTRRSVAADMSSFKEPSRQNTGLPAQKPLKLAFVAAQKPSAATWPNIRELANKTWTLFVWMHQSPMISQLAEQHVSYAASALRFDVVQLLSNLLTGGCLVNVLETNVYLPGKAFTSDSHMPEPVASCIADASVALLDASFCQAATVLQSVRMQQNTTVHVWCIEWHRQLCPYHVLFKVAGCISSMGLCTRSLVYILCELLCCVNLCDF